MSYPALEAADVPDRQHALLIVLTTAHNGVVEYIKLVDLARARHTDTSRVRDAHDGYQYLTLSPIEHAAADADVRNALAMVAQACAGHLADAHRQLGSLAPLGLVRQCHQERAELASLLADTHRQVRRLADVHEALFVLGLQATQLSVQVAAAIELAGGIVKVLFDGKEQRDADTVRPRYPRWTEKLAGLAVYVLPDAFRARYDEEFRSELWDLGLRGTSRFGQLLHSLSLLNRSFDLRAELNHRNPQPAQLEDKDSPTAWQTDRVQPRRPHHLIVIILAVTGLLTGLTELLRGINEIVQLFR
ncbi:hypothetical protein Rhe02_52080 [Rhizocola hellebori]|uniref:Uncharacterized protein n=1 Tax=Rhizocola hellebori TaxID=1392758 RepID=A0A8J3QAU0_9ACTN|nr:hypothetical protein [Rhizocola hellebori]GIH07141.1 hypothetical protein Rhe02_52080 [Rhizocola hellebori]